jgi:hypothetical protein
MAALRGPRGLSPVTRALAVAVLLGCGGSAYYGHRLRPARVELAHLRQQSGALQRRISDAHDLVETLRSERNEARQWVGYGLILQAQTPGRSLRELLLRCGAGDGPRVQVREAHFEPAPVAQGFARMRFHLVVTGTALEQLQLLRDLDAAFPPVELESAELTSEPPAVTPGTAGAFSTTAVAGMSGPSRGSTGLDKLARMADALPGGGAAGRVVQTELRGYVYEPN